MKEMIDEKKSSVFCPWSIGNRVSY